MTVRPRILFVDDEPRVLDGLRRALKPRCGKWDLDFMTTPAAALEAHRARPYDAVVTDIAMPDMNGLELVQAMQKFAPDSTYIVLTGTADLSIAVEAINKANVFRFFTKPTSADLIAEGIAAGLEEQAASRAEGNAQSTVDLSAAIGLAALNRVPVGVAVTNRRGQILFTNRAAGALLSQKDGLWLGPDNVCRATSVGETALIQSYIVSVCDNPTDRESTSIVAIARPSLKRALTVLVVPLVTASNEERLAALFITDHENLRLPPAEAIGKLFGLTASESRLAYALVHEPDLDGAAKECGITVNTARTYLKQIFAKTGAARQSDLLKLILTTPVVA